MIVNVNSPRAHFSNSNTVEWPSDSPKAIRVLSVPASEPIGFAAKESAEFCRSQVDNEKMDCPALTGNASAHLEDKQGRPIAIHWAPNLEVLLSFGKSELVPLPHFVANFFRFTK